MRRQVITRYFCFIFLMYLLCALSLYASINEDDYLFQRRNEIYTWNSNYRSSNRSRSQNMAIFKGSNIKNLEKKRNSSTRISMYNLTQFVHDFKKEYIIRNEQNRSKFQTLLKRENIEKKNYRTSDHHILRDKNKESAAMGKLLPKVNKKSTSLKNKNDSLHEMHHKSVVHQERELKLNDTENQLSKSLPVKTDQFRELFNKVFLYSAYYDQRGEIHHIRLILIAPSNKLIKTKLWCHFRRMDNKGTKKSFATSVQFYETCESHMKTFAAYLGSCIVPKDSVGTPQVVLSQYAVEMGTLYTINITHKRPNKNHDQQIGICVPPLFGNVDTRKLTEFIELSTILGAEHFTFYYEDKIDEELLKLLNSYAENNTVTLLPWKMPILNSQIWYHGQSAAVWDCLYRNMYKSKLLSFNDIDEFIIPKNHSTWSELVKFLDQSQTDIKPEDIAVYQFKSVFFDSDFTEKDKNKSKSVYHLDTLDNKIRTTMYSKVRTKMLVYPPKVFELGIHHLSKPFEEHFQTLSVNPRIAWIHHYRKCERKYQMDCTMTEKDERILKYKDELLSNVQDQLKKINKSINHMPIPTSNLDGSIKESAEKVKSEIMKQLKHSGINTDTEQKLKRIILDNKNKSQSEINKDLQVVKSLFKPNIKRSKKLLHFLNKYAIDQDKFFEDRLADAKQNREKDFENKNMTMNVHIQTDQFRELFNKVYLYSAYYDQRGEIHHIRLILIAPSNKRMKTKLWCHFRRMDNKGTKKSFATIVEYYETCESHMKTFAAYLGSCIVPKDSVGTPQVVLSQYAVEMGTLYTINITHKRPNKNHDQQIGICVPPLFGNVDTRKLTEFIELSTILGAEHFTFYYEDKIDEELLKLLNSYAENNTVTLLPWKMPILNSQIWYHGQSAAVWDCLYRNMYKSKLLSFNDIDEFIIPKNHSTWSELVEILDQSQTDIKPEDIAVYQFKSVFFDSDFTEKDKNKSKSVYHLDTLDNKIRTTMYSKVRTKMLVYPPRVFEIGIHHLSKPFEEHFQTFEVDPSIAWIHHYRHCQWNYGMNCDLTEQDESILKYSDKLLSNMQRRGFNVNEEIIEVHNASKHI